MPTLASDLNTTSDLVDQRQRRIAEPAPPSIPTREEETEELQELLNAILQDLA